MILSSFIKLCTNDCEVHGFSLNGFLSLFVHGFGELLVLQVADIVLSPFGIDLHLEQGCIWERKVTSAYLEG